MSLIEYQESLRRAEGLAKADPADFTARFSVLLGRVQLADTWREIDAKRSLPLFRDVFSAAEELKRDDPSNFQVRWLIALGSLAYADAVRKTGDLRAALPSYDLAVTRIAAMRETDRGRKISNTDITKVRAERGEVRMALGDLRGAADDAAACLPFAQSFVIADARPRDLRDTSFCYELNGDLALRAGDAASATSGKRAFSSSATSAASASKRPPKSSASPSPLSDAKPVSPPPGSAAKCSAKPTIRPDKTKRAAARSPLTRALKCGGSKPFAAPRHSYG